MLCFLRGVKINKMEDLKQVKVYESVGKQIVNVQLNSDKVLLVFNDGTFSFFQRYQDFDCDIIGDVSITVKGFAERLSLNVNNEPILSGTMKMFVDAGLIDFKELCLFAKDKIDALVEARKDADLKHLKRLQEKYGVAQHSI